MVAVALLVQPAAAAAKDKQDKAERHEEKAERKPASEEPAAPAGRPAATQVAVPPTMCGRRTGARRGAGRPRMATLAPAPRVGGARGWRDPRRPRAPCGVAEADGDGALDLPPVVLRITCTAGAAAVAVHRPDAAALA